MLVVIIVVIMNCWLYWLTKDVVLHQAITLDGSNILQVSTVTIYSNTMTSMQLLFIVVTFNNRLFLEEGNLSIKESPCSYNCNCTVIANLLI